MPKKDANKQLLRHIVLFGWNENTDPAYINKVVAALGHLKYKIPVIKPLNGKLITVLKLE
jgi:hypothetical protein